MTKVKRKGLTVNRSGHKKTFGGDRNVLYLDGGDGYRTICNYQKMGRRPK